MKKTRAPGAGRKAKDPKAGRRPKVAVTVHPDHRDDLKALDTTELLDLGLAAAIPALRHSAGRPAGTTECLFVYHAISEAIRRIELRRDMPEGVELSADDETDYLSDAERELHELLNRFWDQIRHASLFWEPELPE